MYHPIFDADNLLGFEMWLMETTVIETIETQLANAFPCNVKRYGSELACLDIAAPSTLSNAFGSRSATTSVPALFTDITEQDAVFDGSSVPLFGSSTLCDGKKVGDGMVDGIDMTILLYYIFRVAPYDSLSTVPSRVETVQGETDLQSRCSSGISYTGYLAQYEGDTCTLPTRRSLQTAHETQMAVSLHLHRVIEGAGIWLHVRLQDDVLSLQLILNGINAAEQVSLSNTPPPLSNASYAPNDPTKHELRYARHVDYANGDTSTCSLVKNVLSPSTALYINTIGVGQIPTPDRPQVCVFDLYLYVPGAQSCDGISVESGSRAMDGISGTKLYTPAVCTGEPFTPSTIPPPPPLAPPPPAANPPSHPPISNDIPPWAYVLLAILLIVMLCICALLSRLAWMQERELKLLEITYTKKSEDGPVFKQVVHPLRPPDRNRPHDRQRNRGAP